MGNKKISGQTLTIIILAALLTVAIAFGGVYAYYSASSRKVTGKIIMANLNIDLISDTTASGKSEIVISNGTNVVPGQELKNSPLMVVNKSNASIYLVIVYEVNAVKIDGDGNKIDGSDVVDKKEKPIIDIGAPYYNPSEDLSPEKSSMYNGTNIHWIDYVFTYEHESVTYTYRCLVSTDAYTRSGDDAQVVEVIGENKLKLHYLMGDDYQQTSISFAFQAYAIGSETAGLQFDSNVDQAERCQTIVSAIFKSVEHKFLDATINN